MSDFDLAIKTAAEKAVLKIIADGSWITPDYSNRFKMPPEMLADIWKLVDQDALKKKMAARIEDELADRIVNLMAAEIATDVKQILSVKERREALRNLARQHMEGVMSPPTAGVSELVDVLRHIEGAAMDITCERAAIQTAARAAIARATGAAT